MRTLLILQAIALGALGATSLASPVFAQTTCVILTPSADTVLFESATGDLSSGLGPRGFIGSTNMNKKRRYLVRFDVAGSIPAGSTVVSAQVSLDVISLGMGGPANRFQDVHSMSVAWGEGTSNSGNSGMGAPATPGDATWLHSDFNTVSWTQPGGDFMTPARATYNVTGTGAVSFGSSMMADDVQDWLNNPLTNFGWMLKGSSEAIGTAVAISSREASNSSKIPTLTIEYNPPVGTIETFCDPAQPNSTGLPTALSGTLGTGVGSGLHLHASAGPPNQFGYFLVGSKNDENGPMIDAGQLCLSSAASNLIARYNVFGGTLNSIGLFDSNGVLQNLAGTSLSGSGYDVALEIPTHANNPIAAGETWHFQLWHREDGGSSNLSNGVSVTF